MPLPSPPRVSQALITPSYPCHATFVKLRFGPEGVTILQYSYADRRIPTEREDHNAHVNRVPAGNTGRTSADTLHR